MIRVDKVAGSQKNITFHITGILDKDLSLTPIDLGDSRAKLASLVWLIQEKLGLRLWWNTETPLLLMESRNSVRFDGPIMPPTDWDGKIWLSSCNFNLEPLAPEKWFFVVLDFDR